MESMPAARVLVVNPGSSSLKLSVLGADDATLAEREVEHPGDGGGGLDDFVALHADDFDAAGVRVVHGGGSFRASVRADDRVVADLDRISDLAPLHNPPALAALRHLLALRPSRPVVACFDTAFHAQMPDAAAVYAGCRSTRRWASPPWRAW